MDCEVPKRYRPPQQVQTVSVVLCGDSFIHRLNAAYRGKDRPTDVLSFSQLEGAGGGDRTLLGDIVISVPTLIRQAKQYRVTERQELLRLLIHGVLHLFGFDHENVPKAEERRMHYFEDLVMGRVG